MSKNLKNEKEKKNALAHIDINNYVSKYYVNIAIVLANNDEDQICQSYDS